MNKSVQLLFKTFHDIFASMSVNRSLDAFSSRSSSVSAAILFLDRLVAQITRILTGWEATKL